MIHIREAVIVEGKYDQIRLSSLLDATIVVTNGFGIFKDKQRMAYIRYEHPGSDGLAEAVADVAAQANVILMKNHGVILYDATMAEARQTLEVLENTCRMCLAAQQAGLTFDPVKPDVVEDFLLRSGYRKPREWKE